MTTKRIGTLGLGSQIKRRKSTETQSQSYFQKTLEECKLIIKPPPAKCETSVETVYIVRNLKRTLQEQRAGPDKFLANFKKACNDDKTFEHYLFPNIVRKNNDIDIHVNDSVIRILLNVTFLQSELIDFVFNKVIDELDKPNFASWTKMILKSFSALDAIECSEELATKLIDLLEISSDKQVKCEIISAIPEIIGDQEHDNVAKEMSRILSSERDLIPYILDCLSYLCLSDERFESLQKVTLEIIQPSNVAYFSNFVKFMLTPGRLSDGAYEETVKGLRQVLGWSAYAGKPQDIATSQVLTSAAIRSSMLSSKAIAKSWLKVISSCKISTDHKPIDIIFLLILYTVSDDKQKLVEDVMRKQIKLQILKESLLDEAFKKFKPILKANLANLISLTNTLLNANSEPLVQNFASHMYMVMFSELSDCCDILVAELLQLALHSRQSVLSSLNILNNIASMDMNLLKLQSIQMLMFFDKMDEMSLFEVSAVMNLVCRLAYGIENSNIRDDLHIIIRKELGSSIPTIKDQGILAGIHAVKYLTKGTDETEITFSEDLTINMTSQLPEGDLREAAQIIQLINHSTKHFPNMKVFFYDEMYKIIQNSTDMSKNFIGWLYNALMNDFQEKILVESFRTNPVGDLKLSMQLCVNEDSEVDEVWAVDIAGLTLEDNKEFNIGILPALFKLIAALHYKMEDGDLSGIDALLGCPIVMPDIEVDEVKDMAVEMVKKILDCHVHCINWIRELLNAFASQTDEVLKPKISNRILQWRRLERNIEEILLNKDMAYKAPSYILHTRNNNSVREQPERKPAKAQVGKQKKIKKGQDDTAIPGTAKPQPTQANYSIKNKLSIIHNIDFRPLNLSLVELLRYNLTPQDGNEPELTFELLNYLLSHVNGSFEKILVPKIKKTTFLTKVEVYSRSEAQKQAKIISNILPKIMAHVDFVTKFLECHIIDEDRLELDTLFAPNIIESSLCLENLYNLLAIYFRWIEFKNDQALLLQNSLKTVAKIEQDKQLSKESLLEAVVNVLEKQDKYCITLSSAVSLIELMKALQEHSTGSRVLLTLRNMAHKFLTKQWKTSDDQLEKGLLYNQGIDRLTKVYLTNNTIADIKAFVTELESDAEKLRDKSSVLQTLKSISKNNFSILFRNLGTTLCDKIRLCLDAGYLNEEHVGLWKTVATTFKLMSSIVANLSARHTSSAFLKTSIELFKLFLSKGIPILKIEFKQNKQTITDILKDFHSSSECLDKICSTSDDGVLMKKIPSMKGLLEDFNYETRDLFKSNDCLELINVVEVESSARKSKKAPEKVYDSDVSLDDCDDDLQHDVSDMPDLEPESVGISDIL